MKKLEAAHRQPMRWKNGGGTTYEIACSPMGASLDEFDWRVSMADVQAAGPFSRFVGVDRSLIVLSGDIEICIGRRGTMVMNTQSAALAFPGDIDVCATPRSGPVQDLNVMTRRGRFRHLLTRIVVDAPTMIAPLGDWIVVIVIGGSAVARGGNGDMILGDRDALVCAAGQRCDVAPLEGGATTLAVVDLFIG